MKPQMEPSSLEVLAGLVERVTYHNDGNGYCVLRIKARGHRELVTVVGHAAVISAGEWITASGEWVNDRTHGQQYRAKFLKTSEPTSLAGIEKYLGSGMIRGIGPVYAKKLGRAFGDKVFDIARSAATLVFCEQGSKSDPFTAMPMQFRDRKRGADRGATDLGICSN
jgi:exodeoxyribonuclease V alpha subunit